MTLRLVYLLFYQLSARIGLLARSEASRGALKATEKLFSAAAFGSAQVPPAGTTAASRQINGQTTNPRGAQVTMLHRVFEPNRMVYSAASLMRHSSCPLRVAADDVPGCVSAPLA